MVNHLVYKYSCVRETFRTYDVLQNCVNHVKFAMLY